MQMRSEIARHTVSYSWQTRLINEAKLKGGSKRT